MKIRQTFACITATLAFGVPAAALAQVRDASEIVKPPLRSFRAEQPRLVTLPNGLVLMLQADRELPLIRGYALIRGGSRDEPADKAGLVSLFGQAWRTGGSKLAGHGGDQLDELLEDKAAQIETGGGLDSTSISWDCLKGDFGDVLGLVAELLRTEPAFPADKLALAKTQLNSGIARRNDNADGIARREGRKLGYGADSPYARQAEYATVAAVTRDDLVAWHRRYVQPSNIVMAVWGDFDPAQMERRLRDAFAAWPRGTPAPKTAVAVANPKPGYYLIDKDDVTQSNIQMVHLGLRLDTPDYFAIEVMNEIFGGAFSARLMTNIRAKQGLAYGVRGSLGMAYDYPGLFTVAMGTKSESTVHGIEALLAEIDGMTQQPITAAELARAKDGLLNSFIFRIDSKDKVLRQKVSDYFHGYSLDRLERYQAGIQAVTPADVERVARQYLHKDKLAILVVGKTSAFDRPLSSLGPVTPIDITIPGLEGPKPKGAVAGSDAAGRALLVKALAAFGDPAKVKALKSTRCRGTSLVDTPQGQLSISFERTLVLPDRVHQKMTTPMGEMTMVLTPQGAFMAVDGQQRDLPGSIRDDQLAALRLSPAVLAQTADDPDLSVRADGTERVGDIEGAALVLSSKGASARWVIDPANGRILRLSRTAIGQAGPTQETQDYSDYRTVDGINLAFQTKVTRSQGSAESATLESCDINPTIAPTLFDKPAAPPQ